MKGIRGRHTSDFFEPNSNYSSFLPVAPTSKSVPLKPSPESQVLLPDMSPSARYP